MNTVNVKEKQQMMTQYVVSEDDGNFSIAKVTEAALARIDLIWCETICTLPDIYDKVRDYCIAAMHNKHGTEVLNEAAHVEVKAMMTTIEELKAADTNDIEGEYGDRHVKDECWVHYTVGEIEAKI
jgi:hypothetical protein